MVPMRHYSWAIDGFYSYVILNAIDIIH